MQSALGVSLLVVLLALGLPASDATSEAASDDTAVFRVTPDPRLCPSPICGGAFARAVNRALTTCADGSERATCYVAEVDYSALSLSDQERTALFNGAYPDGILVRGRIEPSVYPGFGNLGVLHVSAAWRRATDVAPMGSFYLVRDNGIRCFTSPCFSYQAVLVNTTSETTVSGVDLSKVGAGPEELAAAQRALAGTGLLVAGDIEPQPNAGPAGEGRLLVVSQFYLAVGDKIVSRPLVTVQPVQRIRRITR